MKEPETAPSETRSNWFSLAFQLQGSVALVIWPRVLLFAGFGFFVSYLDFLQVPNLERLGSLTNNVVCNLVLGLLLVFRTNTSYERFWEGRKAWGMLVVNTRNLARAIRIGITIQNDLDRQAKQIVLQLLIGFAIATKLHLRQDSLRKELQPFIEADRLEKLVQERNAPLQIVVWMNQYLYQQYQQQNLDSVRLLELEGLVNNLVEGLTNCERILKTPLPIAYVIYLKRLLLLYCLSLPFSFVPTLHFWTGPLVAIVSFILLGVEEVGSELENPFGWDANDLPLDDICRTLRENVESLIRLSDDFEVSKS